MASLISYIRSRPIWEKFLELQRLYDAEVTRIASAGNHAIDQEQPSVDFRKALDLQPR